MFDIFDLGMVTLEIIFYDFLGLLRSSTDYVSYTIFPLTDFCMTFWPLILKDKQETP